MKASWGTFTLPIAFIRFLPNGVMVRGIGGGIGGGIGRGRGMRGWGY